MLLYLASLLRTSLHWHRFLIEGKVKVSYMVLGFSSTIFDLKVYSAVAYFTELLILVSNRVCLRQIGFTPLITDQQVLKIFQLLFIWK